MGTPRDEMHWPSGNAPDPAIFKPISLFDLKKYGLLEYAARSKSERMVGPDAETLAGSENNYRGKSSVRSHQNRR
jgi:hypothetical protein